MISLKNISKRYGENIVYDNFNLLIEENKTLVILGESGSGKTTLLNILMGLTDFSGEIIGKPDKLSVVFQKDRLVQNLTVEQNIKLTSPNADVGKVLQEVGLSGQEKALPKSLSAGMARRVAIARALVNDAPVILMDEPFINLDIGLKFSMIEKLKSALSSRPRTVVAVTHDIKEAVSLADRIIVIANGKIVKDMTEIKENAEKELFDVMMNISEKI